MSLLLLSTLLLLRSVCSTEAHPTREPLTWCKRHGVEGNIVRVDVDQGKVRQHKMGFMSVYELNREKIEENLNFLNSFNEVMKTH